MSSKMLCAAPIARTSGQRPAQCLSPVSLKLKNRIRRALGTNRRYQTRDSVLNHVQVLLLAHWVKRKPKPKSIR